MSHIVTALLLLAISMPAIGLAQPSAITGSVRNSAVTSTQDLDDRGPLVGTAVWVQAAPRLGDRARVFADGWVGIQDVSSPDHGDGELREMYVDVRLGGLDLRAGKQIIVWGRADGINPTDNLTPRNLTLWSPDSDDQRTGVPAVVAAVHRGTLSFSGVWVARARGSRFPFPTVQGVRFQREPLRDRAHGFAVKVERVGGGVDASVSYFRGLDPLPDMGVRDVAGDSFAVGLRHHTIHVVGADVAAVLGRIGLRAEAAYTGTVDRRGADPEIKNPSFLAVMGAERTLGPTLSVNVQYVVRVVRHVTHQFSPDANAASIVALQLATISQQLRSRQHGLTIRVANTWRNETVDAEVAMVEFAGPRQGSLRSRVAYALSDRWRLIAGADWLRGEPTTLFHQLRKNSTWYGQLRYGFQWGTNS